jgi:hypothetical protein
MSDCRRLVRVLTRSAISLILFVAVSGAIADEPTFRQDVQPFLTKLCFKCHGADLQEGNVNFAAIADDRAAARQRKLWRKAVAQIEAGEMPPKESPQPTVEERTRLLGWMKRAIDNVDCTDPANRDPGPALIRRLSLAEYNSTIRDLMGFEFDAASTVGMTDDSGEGNSFGNLATALDLPPALMDKYFSAADLILDRFFGTELSSSVDGQIQEQAQSSREKMFSLRPNEWRKPDFVVAPPKDVPPRAAARLIVTPFLRHAYRGQTDPQDMERLLSLFDRAESQGKSYLDSIRLMLKAILVSPKFLYRIERNQAGKKPDEAYPVRDLELASRLSYFLWSSQPDEELLDLAERGRLSTSGPSTELVKLNGKIIGAPGSEKFQGNNRDKVFDGDLFTILDGPDAASHWIGLDLGTEQAIHRVRYAGRIGLEQRMVGGQFQASNNEDFSSDVVDLFTVPEGPPRGWINHDLNPPVAKRFVRYVPPKNSYGNIAEIELRGLSTGTVLEQQTRRLLADPRAKSLTENFAARWLQINKLHTARPSTEFFPEFNGNVRQAMYDETITFFDALRRENRSLLELLDADYTFANEELATYYGLPGLKGREMQRVKLKPEHRRGGLLGMGSVLALTSHTSRTSPTMRGKWILEVMFGTPPPPPPANVSQIKDEQDKKKEAQSFREKLTQHAQDATCAACHRKMDPLGFALDNYNAVGLWREKVGDQTVDVTGELPTGEKLNGSQDLKRVLLQRKDEFTRNLAEQMYVYALGRELDFYDDCPVRDVVDQLKADDYRYSHLVLGIVRSYPFLYRKNLAEE